MFGKSSQQVKPKKTATNNSTKEILDKKSDKSAARLALEDLLHRQQSEIYALQLNKNKHIARINRLRSFVKFLQLKYLQDIRNTDGEDKFKEKVEELQEVITCCKHKMNRMNQQDEQEDFHILKNTIFHISDYLWHLQNVDGIDEKRKDKVSSFAKVRQFHENIWRRLKGTRTTKCSPVDDCCEK